MLRDAHLQRQRAPAPSGPLQRQLIQGLRKRYTPPKPVKDSPEADLDDAYETVRTIASAAKLLSEELYVKDDHVVLELVQNADDCAYDEGTDPSFQLMLFDDGLLCATNERGFAPANVRAICNLDSSSKSRSLGAFTGEKAACKEAAQPSCGGFKFVFDVRQESYPDSPELRWLGLVRPAWVGDLSVQMEEWITSSLAEVDVVDAGAVFKQLEGYGTCMWLDLKPDCDRHRLARQLGDIRPFMLLNLRQLRHMRVLIATRGNCHEKRISYAEQDGTITLTELQGLSGGTQQERKHHLLRLLITIKVPGDIGQSEEKRQGVKEVGLMFALPMEEDGVTACPDPHSGLFAFLPVASFGFRFNIQADFVLPSSREGILEDRPWNKWLRDQLAPAFVGEALQAQAAGRLSCGALLQFLPLPGDVLDGFLGEAASSMLELLQQEPCVLAASGQHRQPADTLLPDALLQLPDRQQLISNSWLQQGLGGREYVHADVLGPASTSTSTRATAVLQQLGASSFSADLLVPQAGTPVEWLTAEGTAAVLQQQPDADRISWLQSLYVCLHRLTAQVDGPLSMKDAAHWKDQLAAAPILPVHGQAQPISHQAATSQGRLFLWDPAFGCAADTALFSEGAPRGSSTSLLFMDPAVCAAQPEVEAVLQHFFGLNRVPMSVLVESLLQQQNRQSLDDSHRQQQLLFPMRNRQHLGPPDGPLWKQLQGRLQLRAALCTGSSGYSAAAALHFPCSCAGQVPAELQQDFMKGGLLPFLHPWFEQLLSTGSGGVTSDDARVFLNAVGVRELSVQQAVTALLQLYGSVGSLAAVRWEQHLRHVCFMAAPAAQIAVAALSSEISSSLRLYSHTQKPGSEGPKHAAGQLFAPLPKDPLAASISRQLITAGAQLAHDCYCADTSSLFASLAVTAHDLATFLTTAAGVQAGPNAVRAPNSNPCPTHQAVCLQQHNNCGLGRCKRNCSGRQRLTAFEDPQHVGSSQVVVQLTFTAAPMISVNGRLDALRG